MSVNRLKVFQSILVTQLNHWTCFMACLLYFVISHAGTGNGSLQVGAWLLFGLVPGGLYLTGLYVNKDMLFWVIHLGVLVVVGVLPMESMANKLIYLGMTFIYCVVSVLFRYGKDNFNKKYLPLPAYFGITVVLLLVLQYLKLHEYQRYYLYLLILLVFLCCVTMYSDRYLQYVELHKYSIGYMPVQNMFVAGMKVIGFFAAVLALAMAAVAGAGEMNDILGFFREKINAILKKFVEFLREHFKEYKGTEWTSVDNASGETAFLTEVTQETTGAVWADILLLILFVVLLIFLAKCFLKLLLTLLGRLKLPQSMSGEEEISLDVQEVTRRISREKKYRYAIWAGGSPAEKIRRRYKKKISNSQDIIATNGKCKQMEFYTARESADILNMPQMAELYEKARYSTHECTIEDAKYMKMLCKSSK